VARAAGVSIATVSRVFNNNSLVSSETAERVVRVAASFDYWPNSAAQNLATRCSRTFGVLLPDLFGEFYSDVIRGMDRRARLSRFQILLSSSHSSSADVLAATRSMLGRIDGLIMMAPDEESIDMVERVRRRIPVVLLSPRAPVERCHSLGIDNFGGAKQAVEHLLSLGHREIAFISGPKGNVDAEERLQGFRQAFLDAGLDPDRAVIVEGDFRESTGFEAGSELMALRPRPSAVFTANDSMAIGLLASLNRAGFRVPDDLAVVGFDDVAIAGYLNPPLSSVHVDACGMGSQAVGLLLGDLNTGHCDEPVRVVIPAVLKVRISSGASVGGEEGDKAGTG